MEVIQAQIRETIALLASVIEILLENEFSLLKIQCRKWVSTKIPTKIDIKNPEDHKVFSYLSIAV